MKVYFRKRKEHLDFIRVHRVNIEKWKKGKFKISGTIEFFAIEVGKKRHSALPLKNKLIKPNQWFEIPGFLEEYLSFKKFSESFMVSGVFVKDIYKREIKKFEKKLSPENKLLLEVSK